MYLNPRPPSHYLGYIQRGKPQIVLIPAISTKWGFMKKLGDKISLSGHPVFIVPKLGHNFLNIPDSAKYVKEVIIKNNLKNVILVGYSKGGLIGKYLLIFDNQDNRVKGLIAIASPFSGTRITKFIPHKSYQELLPDNQIIKKLNNHQEVNSQIISIYPSVDNHIWSEKGSQLQGGKNIEIPVTGHSKVIFYKKTVREVMENLQRFN